MWGFDRFSGHSTPSGSPPPQSRSFSPAPRRPSHLGPGPAARLTHSPRSSSLNVSGKYDSTTSLNSPRLPNGSGLKQQITPSEDYTNPLKLLEDIVGRPLSDDDEAPHGEDGQSLLEKPAELVEDVDFGGRSIYDFLEDEGKREGIGVLDSYDNTAQSAMECEYVYSHSIANFLILNVGIR